MLPALRSPRSLRGEGGPPARDHPFGKDLIAEPLRPLPAGDPLLPFKAGAGEPRPAVEVEGGAEDAGKVGEGGRVVADRRGGDGDVAGKGLQDGKAETLPLGGDDDEVGGVVVVDHLGGGHAAKDKQSAVEGAGEGDGPVVPFL